MKKYKSWLLLTILLLIWIYISPNPMQGKKVIIRIYQSDIPSVSIGTGKWNTISHNSRVEGDVLFIDRQIEILEEPIYTRPWIKEGPIKMIYEGEVLEDYTIKWRTDEPEAYILTFMDRVIVVNNSSSNLYYCGSPRIDIWGDGDWHGPGLYLHVAIGPYSICLEPGENEVRFYSTPLNKLDDLREGHYLLGMDFTFENDHLDDNYYVSPGRYWICETEFDFWPNDE